MVDLFRPCLRVARGYVSRTAVRDRGRGLNETVCSVTVDDVARHLAEVVGGVDWRVVYQYRRGLVLRDGRGRGLFQRVVFEDDFEDG